MNDLDILKGILQQVKWRIRVIHAMNGLAKGLFFGCIAMAVILLLYKFLPVTNQFLLAGAVLLAVFVLAGLFLGVRRPLSLIHAARWLDEKQQLKERISTAMELSADPKAKEWSPLVIADAKKHVQDIKPQQIIPFNLPKICQWTVLVLVLGASLGFVPEHRSERYLQKKREVESIREAGRNLENLTRRKLNQSPPFLEATHQNLQSVSSLGDHLQKATLTRNEALKDISNVADKLKQEARQLAQSPVFKRLEKAARESSASSPSSPSQLQKKLDEMAQQMGRQSTNAAALDQLRKDLQKAKEAAQGLANSNQNEGNNDNKDQLEKSLSSLARKAQDLGVSLPSLDSAIDALASAQTELFVRELNAALSDLEKMREMSQAMQQLQQQIEAMAKNLGEQLEKGQARTAQETLNKMSEILKSSNASPEQINKILKEVADAVKPAAEYGKVADLLKQATSNMTAKNNAGAAQKLDEAAKELERLLAEMGDLDSLQAMMESLEKASMSVGTGLNWGQCQGNMLGGRGAGKGGKGFGTWVDEEGWQSYPEYSELWENPADDRGNMDSRSSKDRGDGQLSENIDSTKIRGRMSPGGSMPSITLKGVSIKGQSSVAFQEAVIAAQSQAETALSQDQIPKAYRGAVKDYFNDMNNK